MNISEFCSRVQGRYWRTVTGLLFKRSLKINSRHPYITFTFDDFPVSALHKGGEILEQFGLRATYYAFLGLMGTKAPVGTIFVPDDIKELLKQGHELGCHTFAHCHSLETSPRVFEDSIIENQQALDEIAPGVSFKSFSYPISGPRLDTKRRVGKHFRCSRGGGQTYNVGMADLNYLKAFFIEKSRDDSSFIDQSCRARGWLIFAAHDISETPSPFGCTPSFFEDIVRYSLASGATILPVTEALDAIFKPLGVYRFCRCTQ